MAVTFNLLTVTLNPVVGFKVTTETAPFKLLFCRTARKTLELEQLIV